MSLGLAFYSLAQHRKLQALESRNSLLQLVRVISSFNGHLVSDTKNLLIVLAKVPEVRTSSKACSEFLANTLKQYPYYANLGVVELTGDIKCTAVFSGTTVNALDRVYFQRAVASRDFSVGEYQIGRITGKPSVNFGWPIINAAGRAEKVVFAALSLEWVNQMFTQAKLPAGSVVNIIDRNGILLARYPEGSQLVGKPLNDMPLKTAMLSKQEGAGEFKGIDGTTRFYAYAPLPQNAGVFISIGIPKVFAFAKINYLHQQILTIALFIIISAVIVGFWLFLSLEQSPKTPVSVQK